MERASGQRRTTSTSRILPLFFLVLVGICARITVADGDIKAHVGETVALPCRVDTKFCGDVHSVKFYRETSRIYVYSQVGGGIARAEGDATKRMNVEYTPASSEALLKITPVKLQDEASYKCEITYLEVRENCDIVQIIKLTTLVKPETVTIRRNKEELPSASTLGPHNEGTQVELICETSEAKPVPKVTWYNGSHELTEASSSQSGDRNGVGIGSSKLQVILSRGDLGVRYQCKVESAAIEQPIIRWLSVDVNVRPTSISLSGVKDHVVQGSRVTLTCEVSGARPPAEVRWFNETTPITSDELIRNEVLEATTGDLTYKTTSTFSFIASRFEDGNAFHCYADNAVTLVEKGSSLHDFSVFPVYYPPVVTVPEDVIITNETGEILLNCTYISNPMQLGGVVWVKDDKNLTLTKEKYEGGDIDNPPLRIKNITREDMGNYSCVCSNSVGSAKSEDFIFVDVQYPPAVEVQMDPSTPVRANDKGNVTLFCKVADGNPTILQKVRWFLGGELLKELPECNYTSFDENGNPEGSGGPLCGIEPSLLSLEYVEESFAGNYTCQGENVAGWGAESQTQELIVYYPPSPARLRYSPRTVIKKASVTLECSVDHPGRPENVTYLWFRGGHQVQATQAHWNITPVMLETKSNFTCIASNEGGNSTPATVFIDVLAPPAFIQNLSPYQGILVSSKNVSLTCRVECYPMCSIKWFKDGHLIDTGSSHLYYVKESRYGADSQKNDFESIESTLIWNMSAWPGKQLDKTAPNSFYTCQSSANAVGPGVNSTIEIAVDFKPENLSVSKVVVSVPEGQEAEKIVCEGKGHPKLSYIWKKEGSAENVSKSHELKLNVVTRTQSGKYICEAFNRRGSATTLAYLNVQYAPTCKLDKVDREGSLALECIADANPQVVTFVYKIKGENETIDSADVIQSQLKSYLKLESGVDTLRTYQCFVNNSVGIGSPCEYDVAASDPWWMTLTNDNKLYILIAAIVAIIICIIIICIIIILVCRRKRASNKYNNPVEMEEREKPDGQSPNTSGQSRWPFKPNGVLLHNTKLSGINIAQFPSFNQIKTAPRYKRNKNKLCDRLARLRQIFGFKDEERTPLGVYSGSGGVVTFRKLNATTPNLASKEIRPVAVSRKRKKPGYPPNPSSMGDKGGLGGPQPDGGLADPLNDPDRGFYENLPFHGMQNPPNKPISIITPMMKTSSNKLVQQTAPTPQIRPTGNRVRLQRIQSFHGFQNVNPEFTTPVSIFNYPPQFRPTQRVVSSIFLNHSIRTNPNFFAQNRLQFLSPNPFVPPMQMGVARVVGRNERKLDIRRTASGINKELNQNVENLSKDTCEARQKQKTKGLLLGNKFTSLEYRKHRCYSPTFYSMRCKKHAKRRAIVYAIPKKRTVLNTSNRSKDAGEKTTKETDEYQNLTDSIQILEQNAVNSEAETRQVPKPAPRSSKRKKSEAIYQNVSVSPKVDLNSSPKVDLDSSNNSSVHEAEISVVTEAIVHKIPSPNEKNDGIQLPQNTQATVASTQHVPSASEQKPIQFSPFKKESESKSSSSVTKKELASTKDSPKRSNSFMKLTPDSLKLCETSMTKSKIVEYSNKSPFANTKLTPTVKVSPNFVKPKTESPKGALYQQLHAKLKNSTSTQTPPMGEAAPKSLSPLTKTNVQVQVESSLPSIPKMPLLDLELHNKRKNEILTNTNQNAFYTLTTPHLRHIKNPPLPQQYSATIPHQKHIKLIPRSLFQEQQISKSKSFSSKGKPKKHFQIPLQKCHSFRFQTAESYFQPIKNIHEENLMKNGYASDLGPNYPESHGRIHKREKHKYKGPLVVRRPSDYHENVQFQENMQNSVQLQYPQPVIGRSSNANGIVYADLDMHSSSTCSSNNKKHVQDTTSSTTTNKPQKVVKAKTEYATLKFNDIGQEIDV